MKTFTNNFLNLESDNNQVDYQKVSKKMASLYFSCFKNSKIQFNQSDMFSFLKNSTTHVFYNGITISIIQVSGLEADLLTLLVKPNQQKKGFGKNLLTLTMMYLKQLGIKKLFLEVAVDNIEAIKIYKKLGFTCCGTRKNYYLECNGIIKDALVMTSDLSRKIGNLDKKKLQRLYPTG